MDSETYNNNLLGKPYFSPYFPNKTTSVAGNEINTSKPHYLILIRKNEVMRLEKNVNSCY